MGFSLVLNQTMPKPPKGGFWKLSTSVFPGVNAWAREMIFQHNPRFHNNASIIRLRPHAASPRRPASLASRFSVGEFLREAVRYPRLPHRWISSSTFDQVVRWPRAKSSARESRLVQLCPAQDPRELLPRPPVKQWPRVCSRARQTQLPFRLVLLRPGDASPQRRKNRPR